MSDPQATMTAGGGDLTLVCKRCNCLGSDVRLSACGCTLHARCVPLDLILDTLTGSSSDVSGLAVKAAEPNARICCFCHSSPVPSIEMFPMTVELLDKAVEIRRLNNNGSCSSASLGSSSSGRKNIGGSGQGKRKNISSFGATMAEASYLLMSSSYSPLEDLSSGGNSLFTDGDFQRTGRWTDEEVEFVDYLLLAFDQGQLPLPQGVRLNEFLCQMLLCKGSRLTKKMKNAKLSARSYSVRLENKSAPPLDFEKLSNLQEKFLKSISNVASQCEIRFQIMKTWKLQFSNLCIQVKSDVLDANEWIASVEEMEQRAANAEETIRTARRKRMGLALKKDAEGAPNGVFFAGLPFQRPKEIPSGEAQTKKPKHTPSDSGTVLSLTSSESENDPFINTMLDLCAPSANSKQTTGMKKTDSINDFAGVFNELIDPSEFKQLPRTNLGNNCGSFLDRILNYMETNDLPFQHVDVWVPSLPSSLNQHGVAQDTVLLNHAGSATRYDIDPALLCQMCEYGEYSTKFSFAPGAGLPGRVFNAGEARWECNIDEASPAYFERAGGAKVYGIKTAVGIPLKSKTTGCVIVAMYGVQSLPPDENLLRQLTSDLARYTAEPKWKLVVDLVLSDEKDSQPAQSNTNNKISHFQHNRRDNCSQGLPTPHSNSIGNGQSKSGMLSSGNGCKDSASNMISNNLLPDSAVDSRQLEFCIAKLLGDYMPLTPHNPFGPNSTQQDNNGCSIEEFVSLRLLLLRPSERRNFQENNVIEAIRRSYQDFSRGGKWSDAQLASLIVMDWSHLRSSTSTANVSAAVLTPTDHQCHVLDVPKISTTSACGAPARLPFGLGPGNNSNPTRSRATSASFSYSVDSSQKKRRISSFDEGMLFPKPTSFVNETD